jgi:hypothetical protein
MFAEYNSVIKKILSGKATGTNWKEVLKYHRLMLARIQHERLIHLLVTIFVGSVMTLTFLVTMTTEIPILVVLDLILMVLFIGYIFHYRFLENTTQNWYKLEDEIREKV